MGNPISGIEKYGDSAISFSSSLPLSLYWQIYPPQLSIDALNTATPNLADLIADLPPPPNRA